LNLLSLSIHIKMVSTTEEVMAPVEVPMTEVTAINEDDFINAQKTFQTGKKNLFLNKYDDSVNNIGDACKIYSSKYGEMGEQCAEIYYYYGRALLELARVESTVLGNALDGVPEDDSPIDDSRYGNPDDIAEEEQNDITEKVIDALCEERTKPEDTTETKPEDTTETKPEETIETNPEETKETNPEETKETKPEETKPEETTEKTTPVTTETEKPTTTETETKMETPTETSAETKTDEKKEGEEAVEEEGEEEEGEEEEGEEVEGEEVEGETEEAVKDSAEAEEISNLQRAWEMFELAKLVYTKNFDNDLVFKNKRIAECWLKLGEISIEQEVYEQAITDISESIRIQEEQKENRDERMLAESFYQLGLCQQFNNLFKEANETYQKSINIMQLRIEKLKGKMEMIKDDAEQEAERNTLKDEITELETLLPEMMSKLEEVNEQGEKSLALIKEAKECMMNTVAPVETKMGGEVKDITNMVKSKRKIDATEETNSVKKTRLSSDCPTENSEPAKMETETKSEEKVEEPEKVTEPMTETVTPITV
jgi:nuclear autoantigenic sperm protein